MSEFERSEDEIHYQSGAVRPDELLAEVTTEQAAAPPQPLMSEGDREYQRKIEALTPNEQLLTREQEWELAGAIQAGHAATKELQDSNVSPDQKHRLEAVAAKGRADRDTLVVSNLRLAAAIVRDSMDFGHEQRLRTNQPGKKGAIFQDRSSLKGGELDYSDRMQAATIGLMRAADKYQPGRARFSTVASYWIENDLSRAIFKTDSPLHVAENAKAVINRLERLKDELRQQGVAHPTTADLALELGVTLEKVEEIDSWAQGSQAISWEALQARHEAARQEEALDAYHEDEAPLRLDEQLADSGADKTVEDEVILEDFGRRLDEALSTLSEREQGVMVARFGLEDHPPMSLDEIGQVFGVTRERIRQIENKTMSKLQHPSRSDQLRGLLDGDDNPQPGRSSEIKLDAGTSAALDLKEPVTRQARPRLQDNQPTVTEHRGAYTLQELEALRRRQRGIEPDQD